MTSIEKFLCYWLPLLLWMALIFLFSCQAYSGQITASIFGTWNVPVRKLAHLLEYFVLAILALRAFGQTSKLLASKKWITALAFSALYALLDEWHQFFVPGRTACLADALVDILGASLALGLMAIRITCQRQ